MIKFTGDICFSDNHFDVGYGVGSKIAQGLVPFQDIHKESDDIWMPNKVAKCVALLQNAILVKHRGERIDSVGKMLNKQSATLPMSSSLVVNWYRLYVPGSHIAFRKELLNIALPFPSYTVSHDGWIGCLACYIGKCVDIDEPLIKYRIHAHNVSVGRKNKFWVKIGYRISLLLALITRIAKNL